MRERGRRSERLDAVPDPAERRRRARGIPAVCDTSPGPAGAGCSRQPRSSGTPSFGGASPVPPPGFTGARPAELDDDPAFWTGIASVQ